MLFLRLMKILITAGPTREYIDPVRFISNRSSGKMGYALAAVAAGRGHRVSLVSGPVAIAVPSGVDCCMVESAAEMQAAVQERFDAVNALIMAAAVADWSPVCRHSVKQKKSSNELLLKLRPVPDILRTVSARRKGQVVVGFAAETGNPEEEALRKLESKGLDMIVGNDVSAPGTGFDVDTNQVIMLWNGGRQALPCLPKTVVAEHIIGWLEQFYAKRNRL